MLFRSGSMFMDYFNYSTSGQKDEFQSVPLDFSASASPTLSFQVAYQLYTDPSTSPNFSDTLEVLVSTDCGLTWNTYYKKYGASGLNQLTTVTPAFSTTSFVPSAAGDWKLELLPLPIASNVIVKFVAICNYENQLYIDDINITSAVGINDNDISNYISVYPNPSTGIVNVYVGASNLGNMNVSVTNVLGEVISETKGNSSSQNKFSLNLSDQTSGVYFVKVKTDNGSVTKKIILNK